MSRRHQQLLSAIQQTAASRQYDGAVTGMRNDPSSSSRATPTTGGSSTSAARPPAPAAAGLGLASRGASAADASAQRRSAATVGGPSAATRPAGAAASGLGRAVPAPRRPVRFTGLSNSDADAADYDITLRAMPPRVPASPSAADLGTVPRGRTGDDTQPPAPKAPRSEGTATAAAAGASGGGRAANAQAAAATRAAATRSPPLRLPDDLPPLPPAPQALADDLRMPPPDALAAVEGRRAADYQCDTLRRTTALLWSDEDDNVSASEPAAFPAVTNGRHQHEPEQRNRRRDR